MSTGIDEPIAHELTHVGSEATEAAEPTVTTWPSAEAAGWFTVSEAARRTGLTDSGVRHAVRAGRVRTQVKDGVRVLGPDDVEALAVQVADRRRQIAARTEAARSAASPRRTLPASPLLRQVALRGGPAACGVRAHSAEQEALRTAKLYGRITRRAADQLSSRVLGMTVWELWPEEI